MLPLYEKKAHTYYRPKIPGITPSTQRFLRLKSVAYLLWHDSDWLFIKHVLRHPIRYLPRLLTSWLRNTPVPTQGDFYYYGVKNEQEIVQTRGPFVLGFSYCEKPHDCPSGRFTDTCIHDKSHPTCQSCFICQACDNAPANAHLVFIPTVHAIGKTLLELREHYRAEEVTFLITACELTLRMFTDWGHMLGIKGVGVRLDGRICNTMKAFALSEKGVKPGRTVVLAETQVRILQLLNCFEMSSFSSGESLR